MPEPINNNTLFKNPFKVNFNPSGYGPIADLVSLYDLIFDENERLRYDFITGTYRGFKLSHDLIAYKADLYKNTGEVNPVGSFKPFAKYCVDIAPVAYDIRSKALFVKDSRPKKIWTGKQNHDNERGWWKYDKEAALYPGTLAWFTETDTNVKPWCAVPDSALSSTWAIMSLFTFYPLSVTAAPSIQHSIILGDEDSNFTKYAETLDASLRAFTSIVFNTNNLMVWNSLFFLMGIDKDLFPQNIEDLKPLLKQSDFVECLKATRVWLKYSAFGDYVVGKDYNQHLHQEASVKHKALIVGKKGDFQKYDSIRQDFLKTTENDEYSENSEIYIPKTAPTLDLGSDKLFQDYLSKPKEQALEEVIKFTEDSDNSSIRGLNTSINREAAAKGIVTSEAQHLSPPGWFDPESRKKVKDYSDKPVLFEEEGSGNFEGRLSSVTVDELWVFIKRALYGRKADTQAIENPNKATGEIFNQTKGKTNQDTYPIRARQDSFEYSKDYASTQESAVVEGDSLNFKYEGFLNKVLIISNSFVSNPEAIQYNVWEELVNLSKKIVGNKTERHIQKFLPWNLDSAGTLSETDTVAENTPITEGFWSPRNTPLSIVEIELWLKILRYNLITQARFLKENFTVVGGLGKTKTSDSEIKRARGSLYQLHHLYNYKVDEPNTVFSPGIIWDYEGKEDDPSKVVLRDQENLYGSSKELPDDSRDFASSDIYLAADGTWRYIFDHVRVPVLNRAEEPY